MFFSHKPSPLLDFRNFLNFLLACSRILHTLSVHIIVVILLDVVFALGGGRLSLLAICVHIETAEEVQENRHVDHEENRQRPVQFAVQIDDQKQIAQHDGELNQLNPGDVLLPPQVLPVAWSHRRQHVVKVHENVHKRVEEADDNALFACG